MKKKKTKTGALSKSAGFPGTDLWKHTAPMAGKELSVLDCLMTITKKSTNNGNNKSNANRRGL